MKKLAIFDLDGTLLDSQRDIAGACNEALAAFGFPGHPVEAYAHFIGNGLQKLLERAVPADHAGDTALIQRLGEDYLRRYGVICDGTNTFFPGAAQLVQTLHSKGVKVAIATNKPQEPTARIMAASGFAEAVDVAYGPQPDLPQKPDPAIVGLIMEELGVEQLSDVIFIGDSEVDVRTARNAGVALVAVTWGTRTRAELEAEGADTIVDTMEALGRILLAE